MSNRREPEPGPEPTLPVTPMLDMAFQLLAFFIFTYHPSDLEGQMQLALPSESPPAAKDPKDVDPNATPDKDPTLEVQSDLTVAVKARMNADDPNRGGIELVSLEDRAGQVGTPTDDLKEFAARLTKTRESAENKSAIKIRADSKLKWEGVVQVMDVCRKAGFDNISFAPPPDIGPGN